MKPRKGTKSTKYLLKKLLSFLCLFVAVNGFVACRRGNEKRYDLKGKVVAVETEKHLVTVSHEEIKGYMPAMTMAYTVPSDSDLQIIAPDDEITATLVINGNHSWLEDLIITRQSATCLLYTSDAADE